jgi:hypothetical protein
MTDLMLKNLEVLSQYEGGDSGGCTQSIGTHQYQQWCGYGFVTVEILTNYDCMEYSSGSCWSGTEHQIFDCRGIMVDSFAIGQTIRC